MDQYLKRYGKFQTATMVHHIFPVEFFPEYQYCEWNLISLSRSSHNMMHDRDTDELTDIGKELLLRTAIKNNIDIPTWMFREKEKGTKYLQRY
jgi:5-methylcytosine-specific restriction endonuclease McrA